MALALSITNVVAIAKAQAFVDAADAGTAAIITIYDGAKPADADTAIGAQTLLATLTCTASMAASVADGNPGGLITLDTISPDVSADATGTAAWFRILTQAAGTTICDGSVGTATHDLVYNTVAFEAGAEIAISSWTFNHPES